MKATSSTEPKSKQAAGQTAARLILQQAPLANSQSTILARGKQLIAHRGDLKLAEAQDIAVSVADGWDSLDQTGRIQYMRLPLLPEERLLYTVQYGDEMLLTVCDSADAPLQRLMVLADQLLALLETTPLSGYNQDATAP